MRISVVMATWNGRRYLPGQLASLVGQVRLPDELVVVDDASDDDTVEIVERFAGEAPFKVRVIANDERLGSTKSFGRGIAEARGDLVALCDQDDLWLPQKLSRIESAFREQPDATFVFTDALLIDGSDVVSPRRMWQERRFTPALQESVRGEAYSQLMHRWCVTGCTMAFRADLRDLALPFPDDLSDVMDPMIHDRWLSLVLSAVGPAIVLDEPLVAYRIHAQQQIGLANVAPDVPVIVKHSRKLLFSREESRDARDYQLRHLIEVHNRLQRTGAGGDVALQKVAESIAHLRIRRDLPVNHLERVAPVAREALRGRYLRFARGLSSIAVDLVKR